jgi:hypothetical protein
MPPHDDREPSRRTRTVSGATLRLVTPLLAAILALALAGCGSSGPKTYLSPDYGFSFDYAGKWRLLELAPADLPEGVSSSVGAWDPRGSGNEAELALDFISVDVLEFGPDSGVSADTLQGEFERWLADAGSSDSSFAVAEEPSSTTIGGLDGYRATYTYTDDGIPVRCTEYWLLTGDLMYDLYTSASEEHWQENQAAFDSFLASFKPGMQNRTPATDD